MPKFTMVTLFGGNKGLVYWCLAYHGFKSFQELSSLPADVLSGSFVTHSFLPQIGTQMFQFVAQP